MGHLQKKINVMQQKLATTGNDTTCPVAIIIRDEKVLCGHRHYTPDKWKAISVWTLPGGRCDEGETVEQTLRREVAEETGITDLVVKEYLNDIPGAKEGDKVPLFLCSTNQEAQLMEPEKFSEWKWFSKENLPGTFINAHAREKIVSLL